jgi:hypothetical protein
MGILDLLKRFGLEIVVSVIATIVVGFIPTLWSYFEETGAILDIDYSVVNAGNYHVIRAIATNSGNVALNPLYVKNVVNFEILCLTVSDIQSQNSECIRSPDQDRLWAGKLQPSGKLYVTMVGTSSVSSFDVVSAFAANFAAVSREGDVTRQSATVRPEAEALIARYETAAGFVGVPVLLVGAVALLYILARRVRRRLHRHISNGRRQASTTPSIDATQVDHSGGQPVVAEPEREPADHLVGEKPERQGA